MYLAHLARHLQLEPSLAAVLKGAELRSILKLTDVQEKLASDGNDFGANTPQSLLAFIKSETEKYRNAVKVSGTKLE